MRISCHSRCASFFNTGECFKARGISCVGRVGLCEHDDGYSAGVECSEWDDGSGGADHDAGGCARQLYELEWGCCGGWIGANLIQPPLILEIWR